MRRHRYKQKIFYLLLQQAFSAFPVLPNVNIGTIDGIKNLFKEITAEFMKKRSQCGTGLDDELRYSKYDYKNKDNRQQPECGHSRKTLHTSLV